METEKAGASKNSVGAAACELGIKAGAAFGQEGGVALGCELEEAVGVVRFGELRKHGG